MTTIVTKIKTNIRDEKVVIFNLMISLISAERQMDLDKLGIDLGLLPSASRKLIQEKIFPKDFLQPYQRLRDRANACLDKGAAIRTEMGCVSSRSEAVNKVEELRAIQQDWNDQLENDVKTYEQICNERILKVASDALAENIPSSVVNTIVDALRRRQPVWEEFKAKVSFKFSAMPINLDPEHDEDFDPILYQAQRDGLVALRQGVFGSLVQHIVQEANDVLKVLNGRKQKNGIYTINYRTVSRITGITDKLHGLAFIHQHISPLAKVIDDALAFMPRNVDKDLPMQVGMFLNLVTCLEAVSDQHVLLARMADKQPLVTVSQSQPQLSVAVNAPVMATPVQATLVAVQPTVAAPAATQQVEQVVSTAAESTVAPAGVQETKAEEEVVSVASQEAAAQPEEKRFLDLPFMGSNLFN